MRDPIADQVHAVISQGLSLRDRMEAGEVMSLDRERTALVEMLALLTSDETWDAKDEPDLGFHLNGEHDHEGLAALSQTTIRFALTSWLDEFFLRHSTRGERWRERTLESVLYKTNMAGQKFWEEASYAEVRGDTFALEVMYWCVMLGFRGDWRDKPDQVEAWTTRIRALLDAVPAQAETALTDWAQMAREGAPASDLPFRRMLFAAMLTFSLLIPLSLLVYWF